MSHASSQQPLSAAEIENLFEDYLMSFRIEAQVLDSLLACARREQDFIMNWVKAVAESSSAMAYQFALHAPQAFGVMNFQAIESWLINALDIYDKRGLYAAIEALKAMDKYALRYQYREQIVELPDVIGVLERFIAGLSGRYLQIKTAPEVLRGKQEYMRVYTDTEVLFLPSALYRCAEREDNFRLYKAIAVHLWAQTRFGTWRGSLLSHLERFADQERALALFHSLERLRLDAQIARELPGLYRDMRRLQSLLDEAMPPGWEAAAEQLSRPEAGAADSLRLLGELYATPLQAVPCCYQGELDPAATEAVRRARLAKEKDLFRLGLVKMAEETGAQEKLTMEQRADPLSRFSLEELPEDEGELMSFQINLDGQPVTPPDNVKGLMESIIQDIGLIPEEYLSAAGDGGYRFLQEAEKKKDPKTVWEGVYHEEGAFLYDEWDHHRRHYRKNWCALREVEVQPESELFIDTTLRKHAGLVKSLRRTFEALRGEDKLLKAQTHGEDIDLDAFVEAWADTVHGLEMSERVFTKLHREERNIAVMFMVDMSGSTRGWINEAEREALVLLCEALETLGDRYAIYGFSGMTRKRCEVYHIKRFDEPYEREVKRRISGIRAQDYTRMGVAIRHLTQQLKDIDARIKLLVTLSDGRPDDYGDDYRSAYGVEDTRQALLEAKRDGVHPFCITLDTEAKDYLGHMYGGINYVVIDEVRKLPLEVADIYRKLTT